MDKRHFLIIVSTLAAFVVVFFAVPLLLVVGIDPLQVLYKHDGEQRYYFHDPMFRNAGLIQRHLTYYKDKKTIIIGSSLMFDMLEDDIRKHAGLPDSLSLCVADLRQFELNLWYTLMLDKESVEHVILELDPWKYFSESKSPNNRLPTALYRGSFMDKAKALVRFEVVEMAWRILRGTEPPQNLESLYTTMSRACSSQAFSAFRREYDEKATKAKDYAEKNQTFDPKVQLPVAGLDAVIAALNASPNRIKTHIILPPIFFGGGYTAPFQDYHDGLLRLLLATAHKKNVFVYGFDDLPQITHNIANYCDVVHYGIGVYRYMLKAIGNGKHLLTPDNAQAYLARVRDIRKNLPVYNDPGHTVSFEGPVNEGAYARYPDYPAGPSPLLLPQ